MKRRPHGQRDRWHDGLVEVPVLALIAVMGVLVSDFPYFPATVRGGGVLVALVCGIWLLCKRGHAC